MDIITIYFGDLDVTSQFIDEFLINLDFYSLI